MISSLGYGRWSVKAAVLKYRGSNPARTPFILVNYILDIFMISIGFITLVYTNVGIFYVDKSIKVD